MLKAENKYPHVKGLDNEFVLYSKKIQALWDGLDERIKANVTTIGDKSATIGTVGSTALYLRTITNNGVAINIVTSD